MKRCSPDDRLRLLAEGRLAEPEAMALEVHVQSCGRCARRLASMAGGEDLIVELQGLQAARDRIAPSLARLSDTERAVTTTLFGHS